MPFALDTKRPLASRARVGLLLFTGAPPLVAGALMLVEGAETADGLLPAFTSL